MRFVLILLIFIIIYGCTKDPNIVAEVGNLKITKQEIQDEYNIRYPKNSLNAEAALKAKEVILDNLVLKKLKLNEAIDMGLDNDETIVQKYNNQKRNIISNRYYKIFVVDKLFPEDKVRDHFEKIKKEVKVSSILLSFDRAVPSFNKRIRGEALILATEISSRAQNGADFVQLARKYSDDPNVKKNNGDLGYFGWYDGLEPHKKAAFDLSIGAVSGPIWTRGGYYIIKVEDKRINQRYINTHFEDQKDQLVYSLYNLAKDSADNVWASHLNQLKVDRDYKYTRENIDAFLKENIKKQSEKNLNIDTFTQDELNMIISSWNTGTFTVKDLLHSSGQNRTLNYSQLADSVKLMEFIENVSSHQFIMKIGEEMKIDTQPDVASQLKNYKEYLLLKEVEQREVRNEAVLLDHEIEDYYQQHIDEFSIPEKIEIWEIFIKDEKMATSIYDEAKGGQNFSKLVKKYSQDKQTAPKDGFIGFKGINERGEVSKSAFQAGANQIIGPVKYRDGWVVAKTGKMTDKIIRPIKVVEAEISRRILKEKLINKQQDWEKELRDKYNVHTYPDILAEI